MQTFSPLAYVEFRLLAFKMLPSPRQHIKCKQSKLHICKSLECNVEVLNYFYCFQKYYCGHFCKNYQLLLPARPAPAPLWPLTARWAQLRTTPCGTEQESFLSWRASARSSAIPSAALARSSTIIAAGTLVGPAKCNSIGNRVRGLFCLGRTQLAPPPFPPPAWPATAQPWPSAPWWARSRALHGERS